MSSLLLSALGAVMLAAAPQERPFDPKLAALFHEALSGELAKEHVIAITRHHRIQGSRGYRHAAEYVLAELRKAGFDEKEAWIESLPSDGKVVYQTWQSPPGWDIESAELRVVEPVDERIVGYPEIAMSVITYSNTGDVTAELVDVGGGTNDSDYTGKDVRGKFVLATGYGGGVHRLAVLKYGAAAVVCYLADGRAAEYPDMLQYTGMWPRTEELEKTTFGFNLTNRQGERLRGWLASGKKIVLRGFVKGIGLEPYFMDVPCVRIAGTEKPDEELLFTAHLDHPKESANDNASGSAAILDIACTLKRLIAEKRIEPPQRTLRFLWVPEWHGTMAWIDKHPELAGPALGGKVLANMNMDMVGEDLEKLHSKLVLTDCPDSIPSVVDDLCEQMAKHIEELDVRTPRGSLGAFNWRRTPYSGGSDHMMVLDRKVPAVMFSHDPDYTHHTSEDTPDKVDPVELERCELIALFTLWHLANLDPKEELELASLAFRAASARVAEGYGRARGHILAATADDRARATAEARVMFHRARASAADELGSTLTFTRTSALPDEVKRLQEGVAALSQPLERELERLETSGARVTLESDARIPKRLTRGPLDFGLPESKLPDDRKAYWAADGAQMNGDRRFELVNFIDGKRNIGAIRDALAGEFTPMPLAVVARYLEDLERVGVIAFEKR